MSRDKKMPPPPPPADPAPPAPAPVDNDKSAVDDVARPYLQMGVAAVIKHLADYKPVDAFLRGLSPVEKMAVKAMPGAVAALMRKMPNAWFKNPEWAELVKDSLTDGFKEVAEVVAHKGKASPEEIEQKFEEAYKAAMDRMLVVDPIGHVHVADCVKVAVFKKPQPQPQQNQRYPNQQPPQQSQSGLTEVTLKSAIAQGLQPSPCCIKMVQEATEKATAAPKSAKKTGSPLEILGSIKDEGLRNQFRDWLTGLPAEDRARAFHALQELDSEAEFHGLMAMDPAIRLEILPLLENRNASHAVRKYLGIAGAFLKNGWDTAADHYKKWNDSLSPEIERQRKRYHDDQGNLKPYVAPTWGQSLRKIFSLFPF